jgi:hypothetical protein
MNAGRPYAPAESGGSRARHLNDLRGYDPAVPARALQAYLRGDDAGAVRSLSDVTVIDENDCCSWRLQAQAGAD